MTTIFLVRHGQSEWNNQGRITGQLNPGLSAKGVEQSEALAQCLLGKGLGGHDFGGTDVAGPCLAGQSLAAIYTSALLRTAQTAQPTATALGLVPQRLTELNEIHMGELQGRHRDERDAAAQALWAQWQADPWGFCVPGGERFDVLVQRAQEALQRIVQRHADQQVLIVGHRATNRVLLGTLFGWPRERWGELRLRSKYLYRVQVDDRVGDPASDPRIDLSTDPAFISTWTLAGSKTGQRVDGFVM